ncbi:MAG: hypothetical protein GY759_15960, partial [Chloroflexi bacterium]|nr:hypothetical protein [Chloroflexota bacterium]
MEAERSRRSLWLIVIAIVAVGMFCCCCIALATAIVVPTTLDISSLDFGPQVTVSETMSPQQFTVDTPLRLVIDNNVGDVDIRAGEGDEVVVEATLRARALAKDVAEKRLQQTDIAVSHDDDEIQIVVDAPDINLGGSVVVDLIVTVPSRTDVHLKSGVGRVHARNLVGALDIEIGV